MADIVKGLKNVWMRGMEAIGDTASSIANNTKYKVQEMNLINRRHEILEDFGAQAYALWQQGEHFPGELQKQLEELNRIDETLNTIRAERLAYLQTVEEEKAANRAAAEDAAPDEEPVEDKPEQQSADDSENESASCADTPDESTDAVPAEEACEDSVHTAPVIEIPAEENGECDADPENCITGETSASESVPTLEVPEEPQDAQEAATADVPFDDPIENLMREQAPAPSDAAKTAIPQRSEFEKKVGRAIDTVQDKVSKLGRVIDRSVQNLAKVVLQNDEKQDKAKEENGSQDE